MKKISLLLLSVIIMILGISWNTQKHIPENHNAVVLELFTSQGCSSCPAADKILKQVAKDFRHDNIIPLSYHVDYWNYIGWKDPYSKAIYSQKQRAYSRKLNSSNYTPQLVINGKEHVVGSRKQHVYDKVAQYLKKSNQYNVQLNGIVKKDKRIDFNYDVAGNVANKTLRFVLVLNEKETYVPRGENSNRKLVNTNIVIDEYQMEANNKGVGSLQIPEFVNKKEAFSIVAIVQNKQWDILGGTKTKVLN